MIINYNGENFQELTKEKVLVDFYADWCGPCKMLLPIIENVSKDIKVIKVNVDQNEKLSRQYGIMSIPCLLLFEKGKVINKNIGFIEEEKLREFIK